MNNGIYLLVLLTLIVMLGTSMALLIAAWTKLSVTLPKDSTPMILIYTALIVSYIVISLMAIQLVVGFILYMIGYGKTDPSLVKYLENEYGYSEKDAATKVANIGQEGIDFFKTTMIKDVDNANSLVLKFHGAGEVFKSVSVLLYVFALGLIFALGVAGVATINQSDLTNNSGFGLLVSSITLSAVSLVLLGIIYFIMVRKSGERKKLVKADMQRLSQLANLGATNSS
jgi:hypothetical protein